MPHFLTPRISILRFCKECKGRDSVGNHLYCHTHCYLYPYQYPKTIGKPRLTPLRAVKEYCHQCTGHSQRETKSCTDKKCFLYPYRLGKNPNMRRKNSNKKLRPHKFRQNKRSNSAF